MTILFNCLYQLLMVRNVSGPCQRIRRSKLNNPYHALILTPSFFLGYVLMHAEYSVSHHNIASRFMGGVHVLADGQIYNTHTDTL